MAQPPVTPPARGARWYLVHAQTGREAVAEINLRRQGYRTFLPSALRTIRHARKLRTTTGAYFPGYLFVSLDPETQPWRRINGTLGVIRLFAADSRPTPVPAGVVEHLIALADPRGLLHTTPAFETGDAVRLIAGPFADTQGVVLELSGPDRVRVLLAIMSREIVVDVSRLAIEALKD